MKIKERSVSINELESNIIQALQSMNLDTSQVAGTILDCAAGGWTSLLLTYLRVDPFWPYHQRWVDDTSYLAEETASDGTLLIVGSVGWGGLIHRNTGGNEPFVGRFRLVGDQSHPQLWYELYFCCDGIVRFITPEGISWTEIDRTPAVEAFIEPFVQILHGQINAPSRLPDAAICLGKCGTTGVAKLVELFAHPDPNVRFAVLEAFAEFPKNLPLPVSQIKALLHDPDLPVRTLAAIWVHLAEPDFRLPETVGQDLFEISTTRTERALTGPFFSQIENKLLACFAQNDPSLVSQILALLHTEWNAWAANLLAQIPALAETTTPILANFLNSEVRETPRMVAQALWRLETHTSRSLVLNCLFSDAEKGRAPGLIVEYMEPDPLAAPILMQAIRQPHLGSLEKCDLLIGLARIEPRSEAVTAFLKSVIPWLIECLRETDLKKRRRAVSVLGEIGLEPDLVIPQMLNLVAPACQDLEATIVEQEDGYISFNRSYEYFLDEIAESIGKFSVAAEKAVPALTNLFVWKDGRFCGTGKIASALQRIGKSGLAALVEILGQNLEYHMADFYIVRALKRAGPDAIPYLVEAFHHRNIWAKAFQIFSYVGPQAASAVPLLVLTLHDEDPAVQIGATACLAEIGPASATAIPQLVGLLKDASESVRFDAAITLGKIGAEAVPEMMRVLEWLPKSDELTCCAILKSFGEIGAAAAPAIPIIRNLLEVDDPEIRFCARYALEQIDLLAKPEKPMETWYEWGTAGSSDLD
ncbi:MAG: HEAT repeat domain-containing protein [Acidobacteria bacterium]|nr:HEAT repeat domain-containing protein [Acidobacteriota bacterium]